MTSKVFTRKEQVDDDDDEEEEEHIAISHQKSYDP